MGNRASLKSALLSKFLEGIHTKSVPSGQIILYEDDTPSEVFILKQGVVKIYDIDDQGNEKILHLVQPPALVPFAFFSDFTDPLKWFYTTLTDCELYVIPAKKMRHMVRSNPDLAEILTTTFSTDVHELLVRLSSLGKTNARDKVIAALKFLTECHADAQASGWWRVGFGISHQLIADLCGITRESAALAMKELQNKKVVRSPRISILEINRNNLLAAG